MGRTRKLKNAASELLRDVRQNGEMIELTHHGRVFARLAPVAPAHFRRRRRPPRGADAVRVATAQALGMGLVSLDNELRARAAALIFVRRP